MCWQLQQRQTNLSSLCCNLWPLKKGSNYLVWRPNIDRIPLTRFAKKSTIPIFRATISIKLGTRNVLCSFWKVGLASTRLASKSISTIVFISRRSNCNWNFDSMMVKVYIFLIVIDHENKIKFPFLVTFLKSLFYWIYPALWGAWRMFFCTILLGVECGNILLLGRRFWHFENFHFRSVGQSRQYGFVQFGQSVHFAYAVYQDGEGIFGGAASAWCLKKRGHTFQPFGFDAQIEMRQMGQR